MSCKNQRILRRKQGRSSHCDREELAELQLRLQQHWKQLILLSCRPGVSASGKQDVEEYSNTTQQGMDDLASVPCSGVPLQVRRSTVDLHLMQMRTWEPCRVVSASAVKQKPGKI